jgi:uncharacterized protein
MERDLQGKYELLLKSLEKSGSLAIAFSGGVDSSFLLYAGRQALGRNLLALTVKTPYIPEWEVEEAAAMARAGGTPHHIIEVPVPDQILNNPGDRCYLCKTFLFTMLKDYAAKKGFFNLADGSNADDAPDRRPGMKALRELHVRSPLFDAGFTKEDIRRASRELGLKTWEKPAYACLLTRIPYGTRVSSEILDRIEKAEDFLRSVGIRAVRVRTHGELARIETEPAYMEEIYRKKLFKRISRQLKQYGFTYVTLDMEGYRTGGMDEQIKTDHHDRKG